MKVATLQERKNEIDRKKGIKSRVISARQSIKSSLYESDE